MPAQNYGPILTPFTKSIATKTDLALARPHPPRRHHHPRRLRRRRKKFPTPAPSPPPSVAAAHSPMAPPPHSAPSSSWPAKISPANSSKRYEANGADLEKLTLLEGQRIYTKSGPIETNITLRDIDLIRDAVEPRARSQSSSSSTPSATSSPASIPTKTTKSAHS